MIGTLCLLLFAAAPAGESLAAVADSARSPQPVVTLPAIEVERERALASARRRLPTAFVTDLRAGVSGRAVESLAEVLSAAAGVRVVQYGGLGQYSTVSVRGAPPGQVSVYLDGAPLTSAAHGVVSLSDLPVTAIERVEVYRSFAPLSFGMPTPGGAINLVTSRAADVRQATLAGGSFGTTEARGTIAARRGSLALLAHAGIQGTNGDYRYFDDNGTPFNLDDDQTSTRVNDRLDATGVLASLSWSARRDLRLTARADVFHRAQGVPGVGAVPAPNPRLAFDRALTGADAAWTPGGNVPQLRLSGSLDHERSRFRDTEGQLLLGRQNDDDRLRSSVVGFDVASPDAWRRIGLASGVSWRDERADVAPPTTGFAAPPQSRRTSRGAHAGIQLRPLGDALTLHAARRWDRQADHLRSAGIAGTVARTDLVRELNGPQAGVRLALPRGLELRANWSRSARAPDFLELFGDQGSVAGNPQLQPESAESRDVGAAWRWAGRANWAALEWSRYGSDVRDLIVYQRSGPNAVRARNASRAKLRGDELSWRGGLGAALTASGAFTWGSALDVGNSTIYRGLRLPQRPSSQSYARLDARAGRWSAALDVQYLGDDYLDPANYQRAPSRTFVGASLGVRVLAERIRLTVEGKNLGDRRVSDVAGFPLPGRSVFVSCETRFGGGGESHTH